MSLDASLILSNGWVLVGDPRDGRLEKKDVRVRDGVVVEIGAGLVSDGEPVESIPGRWLLPGFVDAHHHGWHAAMRGALVDSLAPSADATLAYAVDCLDADELRVVTLSAALAQLEVGTTAVLDHVESSMDAERSRAALDGFAASGLRGWWCTSSANLADHVTEWAGTVPEVTDGRARLALAIDNVDEDEIPQHLSMASQHGALAVLRTDPRFGAGVKMESLLKGGLVGPDQLHLSCSTSSDQSLEHAVKAGAAFACRPDLEMARGEGYPVIKRLIDINAQVGLGTGSPAVVGPDPFATMRMALQSERGRHQQLVAEQQGTSGIPGIALRCADILHAATLGGASALGLGDRCGSIQVGKAADLVVVDTRTPRLTPLVDPVVAIVLHLTIADVTDVLVGGRFAKRGGHLVHPDLAPLLERLTIISGRLAATTAVAEARGKQGAKEAI